MLLVVLQGPLPDALRGIAQAPDPTGATGLASPVGYLNLFLYDLALEKDAIPPDESIAVVAIDDASIAQIGRWPWPRTVMATLLDRIAAARPASIAVDVLFSEQADRPADDAALVDALAAARAAGIPVALAVGKEPAETDAPLPLYPLPPIAATATLAHVAFVTGADGRVRGLHLREAHLPALSLALTDTGALPDLAATSRMIGAGRWDSAEPRLVGSLANGIGRISAAALLRGEVDPAELAGRRILIGSSAIGVGDQFATPLVNGQARVSGVELHAATASALLAGHLKRMIDPQLHALIAAAMVLAVMALLYLARPLIGLVVTVAGLMLLVVTTVVIFGAGWWIQPGGMLLAMTLAYPLWSWRRLTAASAGLFVQARALEIGGAIFDAPGTPAAPREPISARLVRIQDAAAQVRRLNRFLMDGIQRLPHPVLIADRGFRVLLANERLGAAFPPGPAPGSPMITWFESVFGPQPSQGAAKASLVSGERRDALGRSWLVDVGATGDDNDDGRWLVQLVDISALRAAERDREEALSFLSHDLRSPQAIILAMIEKTRREGPGGLGLDLSELERQSRRALALTDDFLAYARADSKPVVFDDCDLAALATEVVDLAWFAASARRVRLIVDGVEEAYTIGDAELLRRAVSNLIDNAIRHCRQGGEVRLAVDPLPGHWCVSVSDEGPGIPAALRDRIFEPFWQARGSDARAGSAGLGLAMVQKTVLRHRGTLTVADRLNGPGTRFEIRLPRRPPSIMFDSKSD